jgi:ketosteroid isomerase-like protein
MTTAPDRTVSTAPADPGRAAEAPVPTAAELARAYLRHVEERDAAAVVALLAPHGISEFPFAPAGIQQVYTGPEEAQAFIGMVIEKLIASIRINDLEITEVSPTLAFAELTSDCETKKGLKYQNRYVVKVTSEAGKITLWREFFDPRATETVK